MINWRGLHGALLEPCGNAIVSGLFCLFGSAARRVGVAVQTDCILAITGVGGLSYRRPAQISATVDTVAFILNISLASTSGLSDHRMLGLGEGVSLKKSTFSLRHAPL
jgi:hypothetical protein